MSAEYKMTCRLVANKCSIGGVATGAVASVVVGGASTAGVSGAMPSPTVGENVGARNNLLELVRYGILASAPCC